VLSDNVHNWAYLHDRAWEWSSLYRYDGMCGEVLEDSVQVLNPAIFGAFGVAAAAVRHAVEIAAEWDGVQDSWSWPNAFSRAIVENSNHFVAHLQNLFELQVFTSRIPVHCRNISVATRRGRLGALDGASQMLLATMRHAFQIADDLRSSNEKPLSVTEWDAPLRYLDACWTGAMLISRLARHHMEQYNVLAKVIHFQLQNPHFQASVAVSWSHVCCTAYDVWLAGISLVARSNPSATVVEVGCGTGQAARFVLSRFPNLRWICVDPMVDSFLGENQHDAYLKNMRAELESGKVKLFREPSPDAAQHFEPRSVDVVFLDPGRYSREAFASHLSAWLRRLRKDGVLTGNGVGVERYLGHGDDNDVASELLRQLPGGCAYFGMGQTYYWRRDCTKISAQPNGTEWLRRPPLAETGEWLETTDHDIVPPLARARRSPYAWGLENGGTFIQRYVFASQQSPFAGRIPQGWAWFVATPAKLAQRGLRLAASLAAAGYSDCAAMMVLSVEGWRDMLVRLQRLAAQLVELAVRPIADGEDSLNSTGLLQLSVKPVFDALRTEVLHFAEQPRHTCSTTAMEHKEEKAAQAVFYALLQVFPEVDLRYPEDISQPEGPGVVAHLCFDRVLGFVSDLLQLWEEHIAQMERLSSAQDGVERG